MAKNLEIAREVDSEFLKELMSQVNSESDYNYSGSGFFISKSGLIATNFHVIDGTDDIEIEYIRGGKVYTHKVEVLKVDKKNDLAILRIIDDSFRPFSRIPYCLKTDLAEVGSEVFALGYPDTDVMGFEIKFTDGKISALSGHQGDITKYQSTTPLQQGNSGGPLFDNDGNLIGVNTEILIPGYAMNVSYSLKAAYLKNLIEVLPENADFMSDNVLKDLEFTDRIKVLSRYVVMVKTN